MCDNERLLRELVRASLDSSYEIVEASDGNESLRLARETQPDLIILDMEMPGKSGLEVLAELRVDPHLTETPVVLLTAHAQAADRLAGVEAGADLYLTKPFSPLELARAVAELVRVRG